MVYTVFTLVVHDGLTHLESIITYLKLLNKVERVHASLKLLSLTAFVVSTTKINLHTFRE